MTAAAEHHRKAVPAAPRANAVRLLTVTTLFPNSQEPRLGIFVANRLRKLCDSGDVDAEVVAAVPRFPGAYRGKAAIPDVETVCGFRVRHPRYTNIPGVGMRLQPDLLARALLDALQRSTIGENDFDVIDAHYFYPDGVAAAIVAQDLGKPLVISARGSDINLIASFGFARERMRWAANRADALVAVSAALKARMADIGMPRDRIEVLRNGVDSQVFSRYPRREARIKLGLDGEATWLLFVGNLVHEKGVDVILRALPKLPEVKLLIVGEGPLARDLGAIADACAPGRVQLRGNMAQSELRFAYAACDALCLPSLREGWPNVVLEAMACGTPVAAAPVGGVPEILPPGAPGVLVARHDPETWATALSGLLSQRPAADAVRAHALQFGWDDIVVRQCALYRRVASARLRESEQSWA
jgi:glycosyltransferase involved in cell wall biosynthesis